MIENAFERQYEFRANKQHAFIPTPKVISLKVERTRHLRDVMPDHQDWLNRI
jgi:hypothetical protein